MKLLKIFSISWDKNRKKTRSLNQRKSKWFPVTCS